MITDIKAATILFHLLNVSEVKAEITGSVSKMNRKTVKSGQGKQDVVIIPLATIPDGLQEGYINVNIHVPDFNELIDGVNNLIADTATLERITNVVIPLIEDTYSEELLFWITKMATFPEPDLKEHYLNILVRYGHPNY